MHGDRYRIRDTVARPQKFDGESADLEHLSGIDNVQARIFDVRRFFQFRLQQTNGQSGAVNRYIQLS